MPRNRDEISESDDHNSRGIELADRGWLDEAASEFKKAIKLDPNSTHAHDNLATIYAEQGRHLDALLEYIEALKVEPDSPTVHHFLASFLSAHGQDLAIAQYRRAIELEHDFPDAHVNLALALAESGQIEEAIAELEIAHGQAPDDEMVQHELASCLIDLERYPEAIGHLKKIIKTHTDRVEAYVDLGGAYTAQGFYAEAEGVLKSALKIDPQDFSSHFHLAGLYTAWERPTEALESLEQAAELDQEKLIMWLEDDRTFDSLRDNERFIKLCG